MNSKHVAVVGSGYVGLVTGACLAEIGHRVTCVDADRAKIQMLKKGEIPIYEPGLPEVVAANRKAKRLQFTTRLEDAMKHAEYVFIAVNTPPLPNGEADLSYVETVARQVGRVLRRYTVVIDKSTVPVNTGDKVRQTLLLHGKKEIPFDVVSNPEFLREGTAVRDFMKPDRIVVGVESRKAETMMRELYSPLKCPVIVTDIKSAELIKHASNSFLATKISFANALAALCDRVGADVSLVTAGMGADPRIGTSFLRAGLGYGGSCFPKDVSAFIHMAEKEGVDFKILRAVREVNDHARMWAVDRLKKALWNLRDKTIAVWGLAFKPETDDLRNAPALDIIQRLQSEGCRVNAYDPVAMVKARGHLKNVRYCRTPYDAARGADAILLCTEWKEFRDVDLQKVKALLRTPVFLDGRNLYDPAHVAALGFQYHSVGRVAPSVG
ncbi:MAG: UDP-glucose/GDP-mannose dehydrogenase family protein [Elusimicrobia bacterium]|jgi:UDPglucose 6-dehydrogenase|nr:UDP-glucose/GDP-mannose dehydrogenase family protein [Elusimicrobiota bacterium]